MKKSNKKNAVKPEKNTKKDAVDQEKNAKKDDAKESKPKHEKRVFFITTAAGDNVRVEYDEHFRHQMSYHGPVSETGFRSDFSFDGKGDPEAHAKKMADEFQAELKQKEAKGTKKGKAKATALKTLVTKTASSKESKVRKKTARKDGTMSGLDAAAKVLADAGEPLNCKTMVERAVEKGYWKSGGKTPEATVYAAIIREIAKKGDAARFVKTDKGMFKFKA